MAVWFVRIYLDYKVPDDLAESLARNFGQVYVNGDEERTEITFYTTHVSLSSAVNDSMNSVNSFLHRHGPWGPISRIEVMTREERGKQLAAEGITEELLT